MVLITGLSHLLVIFLLLALSIAWGSRSLELLNCRPSDVLEEILFAAGLFFACLEILLFLLAAAGELHRSVAVGLLGLLGLSAGKGWGRFADLVRRQWASNTALREEKGIVAIVLLTAAFLALEATLTMAPLTGSDAMHYHFTTSLLEDGRTLAPTFSLTHSFLTGQAHLLISLGLALGSDRISLGLIFLGGLFAAGALFAIAQEISSPRWAMWAVLTFVSTPLVFWQTSTSGSPDIWMGFYAVLAVLAVSRGTEPRTERWLVLAGFFAGAAAGVKYTGWILPFAIVAYALAAKRSWKLATLSGLASLAAGVWPLARNTVFAGDPFFPFLMPWLHPSRLNSYAWTAISHDVRAPGFALSILHLLAYPILVVFRGDEYGFGQYYGPVVLAFAPLLFFAPWKRRIAQCAGMLWALLLLSNLFSSQQGRFLLPAYPLSLALVFSGFAGLPSRGWRIARTALWGTLLVFLGFAVISDCLYARNFLPVVIGHESPEAFLNRMAPDYQVADFINRTLEAESSRSGNARIMVFFRHLYYLRVPFVDGDPDNSWLMDPTRLDDPARLMALLKKLDVKWIARSATYPEPLARAFNELEAKGQVVPIASAEVENFTGKARIYGQRTRGRAVILRVVD